MNLYFYDGPVVQIGRCIEPNWLGYTKAPTEARARSNLTYQFKKEHKMAPNVVLNFPDRISIEDYDIN